MGFSLELPDMESTKKQVNIWYLLRYLKQYSWAVAGTFVFLILGRVASALDPVWLKKIIDGVQDKSTLEQMATVIGVYFGLKLISGDWEAATDIGVLAIPNNADEKLREIAEFFGINSQPGKLLLLTSYG